MINRMMISFTSLVCWLSLVALVNARMSPYVAVVDIDRADPRVDMVLSVVGQLGFPEEIVKSWQGNPCEWYGINCLEGTIRSITFIAMNLSGTISPHFADLPSLRVIDLSHNSLTGTIPLELTKLNLKTLDLSYNLLHGTLPKFRNVVPNIEGNPDMETNRVIVPSQKSNKKKSVPIGLMLGIVVGLVIAGGGFLGFYLFRKMRQPDSLPPKSNEATTVTQESTDSNEIPLYLLRDATKDFCEKNMVGKGGFGSVYKGKLQNVDFEIAVKRMEKGIGGKAQEQFRSEVSVLTKVHHRNLVVLHGYCAEGNERLLVYQYMPQGTLSRHLFHWKDEGLKPLEWSRRLIIALDVARGLEYLHSLALQSQSYIHRDLKPENILLGDDMRAKVSDFGLARSTAEGRESIRTSCQGTHGYMAPEYALYGRLTTKADVYSFGVILMELVTGQKALDDERAGDERHITVWFRKVFMDQESFAKAIDETIEVNKDIRSSINDLSKLATHCCAKNLPQRPEMTYVVATLTSLTEQWKPSDIEEDRDDTYVSELIRRWKERETSGSITVI